MDKQDNAVPSNEHPFHINRKTVSRSGHLNWTVLQLLQQKPGI